MRWAVLVVLAGCKFASSLAGSEPDANGVASDAPPDAPDAARIVPFCDPTDTKLIACYEFEGNTNDESTNQLDASMTNVGFVAGRVGMAMQFSATSAADVGDSTKFDVGELTIEAWIKPSQIPSAGLRAGVVDMNGQWGLFLHETGRLQCTMVNGISMQIDAGIAADTWTHVACTYDGAATTIYVDGRQMFQQGGGGTLATGGASGISIAADNPPGSGSRLIGLIDQVRLTARALTPAEICASAACPASSFQQ